MQRGGSLPSGAAVSDFLQIPGSSALLALRASYDLRQAPFYGWIDDLAKPDRLARIDFNTHLPFIARSNTSTCCRS